MTEGLINIFSHGKALGELSPDSVLPVIEDTFQRWSTNGIRMTCRFDQVVTGNRSVVDERTQVSAIIYFINKRLFQLLVML